MKKYRDELQKEIQEKLRHNIEPVGDALHYVVGGGNKVCFFSVHFNQII